jgi:hypothetical protein
MGQYKVPQNVEAEDKIIGPLTLKQFIYCVIGVGWALLCFLILRAFLPVMIVVAAPVTILFLLLGLYQRDGQNFEQYLVALVGFFSQSRRRLWTKEPIVESFKIEPVKATVEQTQRNPAEVRSQLDKLATLVDARGWAEQHDDQGVLTADQVLRPESEGDRIIMPETPSGASSITQAEGENDVLDLQNSPLAQNLSALIDQAASEVKTEAIESMKTTGVTGTVPQAVATPAPPAPAKQPLPTSGPVPMAPAKTATPAPSTTPSVSVTPLVPDDILKLATERDDLTVSQLAAQATRVVPLTEGESVTLRNGNGNTSTPVQNQPAAH